MHSSGTCPALVRVVNAIVDHASGVVPDGAGWLHVSVTMERLPLRLRRWFWRARGSIGMNDTGIEAAILRSFVSFPMTQAIIIIPLRTGTVEGELSARSGINAPTTYRLYHLDSFIFPQHVSARVAA
jgi:hypothetical protein